MIFYDFWDITLENFGFYPQLSIYFADFAIGPTLSIDNSWNKESLGPIPWINLDYNHFRLPSTSISEKGASLKRSEEQYFQKMSFLAIRRTSKNSVSIK